MLRSLFVPPEYRLCGWPFVSFAEVFPGNGLCAIYVVPTLLNAWIAVLLMHSCARLVHVARRANWQLRLRTTLLVIFAIAITVALAKLDAATFPANLNELVPDSSRPHADPKKGAGRFREPFILVDKKLAVVAVDPPFPREYIFLSDFSAYVFAVVSILLAFFVTELSWCCFRAAFSRARLARLWRFVVSLSGFLLMGVATIGAMVTAPFGADWLVFKVPLAVWWLEIDAPHIVPRGASWPLYIAVMAIVTCAIVHVMHAAVRVGERVLARRE